MSPIYTFGQHNRIKVRTTAEQEEIKKKERAKKLEAYKAGINSVFEKRKIGVKDESGLAISAKLLNANPDIYTLWNIRREILLHLKTSLSDEDWDSLLTEELRFTEACLRCQPKSYGTWHQRCWVLTNMNNPSWTAECALCNKYLEYDERNFHCWDYRRWVVERAGVSPEKELRFTDEKIATNFSNYSAWHLRSKVLPLVHPDPENLRPIDEEHHKQELELVTNAAFTDPSDQSAWFYQRWLLGRQEAPLTLTHVAASCRRLCVAFNHSLSPQSADVQLLVGDSEVTGWQTSDGQVSSYVWTKQCEDTVKAGASVRLSVAGREVQSVTLTQAGAGDALALYRAPDPGFQTGFSPGVSRVLCDILESCQTLLDIEPDTKWPLLTSVLLMQAIDRKRFKDKTLEYLDLLMKIDHLRANYYSDLKSRYTMEDALEKWDGCGVFSLTGAGLTALYHSQHLVSAERVDLSGNTLHRSLPRLANLQFCQVLILDENKLESLKGLPSLPNLTVISLKKNKLNSIDDVEPYLGHSKLLQTVRLDENPLASTHIFANGCFSKTV